MNKLTRSFLMTGVALAAGLTMATGPAAATTAAPSAAETSAKPAAVQPHDVKRRDRVVGFYRNPRVCHKLGRAGVWKQNWQRYQCSKVWRGFHRGDWALKVSYGWNWHQGGKGSHGHKSHGLKNPGFKKPGFEKPGFQKPGFQKPGPHRKGGNKR